MNAYGYVNGNPLNWIDIYGLRMSLKELNEKYPTPKPIKRKKPKMSKPLVFSGQLGAGGVGFFGVGGYSADSGVIADTSGKTCLYTSRCWLGGLGLFGGLGGLGSVGVSKTPLKSGTFTSVGVFANGGFGLVGGASGNVGIDKDASATSVSGAKGFAGKGAGAAVGFQVCETTIYCDEDDDSCNQQKD